MDIFERGPARGRAKVRILLAALALALVATAVTLVPAGRAAFPGANGKIAFVSTRDGNAEIYVMNADGTGQTRLTNNSATDADPAWSPDGTKIAFWSDRDGNTEIYVMNADGTGQTRLTNNPTTDFSPAWSPDGTKIAFVSDRVQPGNCVFSGNCEIFVMNADGSNPTNLTNNPAFDAGPAWSPDGTKIAFSRGAPSVSEIYVMNPDGSGQTQRTNDGVLDSDPNWSPDGTKIAFTGRAGITNPEIFVINADGSNKQRLTNTANFISDGEPAWSPDGTKIAFSSDRDTNGNGEIYLMNPDGSGVTRLTSNTVADNAPDWQPLLPFAAFAAKAEIVLGPLANDDQFEIKATLTLGAGTNGINPVTEAVSLRVGTFSTTIPAGSFELEEDGEFKFEGVIGGVALEAEIQALGGGSFQLKAEGANADLTGTVNPVAVGLTIGNDGGATTVTAEIV